MRNLASIFGSESSFRPILKEQALAKKIRFDWTRILGELSDHLEFSYLRNGVVHLEAKHPMWVQEVGFYKDQILKKLNEMSGRYTMRDLRVQFKPILPQEEVLDSPYAGLTLEAKIRAEVDRKLALGYRLCSQCGEVYTQEVVCPFCRVLR